MTTDHAAARRSRVSSRLAVAGRWIGPIVGVTLIVVAIWVLLQQLEDYSYADVIREVQSATTSSVLLALFFSASAYLILVGYDALALAYVGHNLPVRRIALGSFVAHAMSHSLGFHMITAGSIRYRFWSSWGLPNADIARALAFASTSFLLGMILISGLVLMFEPPGTIELLRLPTAPLRVVGALLVAGVAAFLVWMRFATRPISLFGTELPIPRVRLALGHLLIAASDWAMAACVAWVLLPAGHGISLFHFIGVFLFALLVGAIGHVPGGVGVFETLVVLMLKPWLAPPEVLGPLILYRLIYYVLPFVAGLLLMVAHEAMRHGAEVFTSSEKASRGFPAFVSLAAGTSVFSAGTILLLSTAVTMNVERMTALGSVVPLLLIEIAHVAAAATGAALLVLAWFVQCRFERAHALTVVALIAAVVASLLRGLVWELAIVLVPALIVLVLSRKFFTRQGALLRAPRSLAWGAGVLIVLVFSVWLGFFSFKGDVYGAGTWLQMSLDGDLPRFLRSMAVVLTGMAGYLLLRRAPQ